MKIALVSPYTLPVCRGNSLTAQRLCDGLRSRGHCVLLFNSTTQEPAELTAFAPELVHSLHALHPSAWIQHSGVTAGSPWVVTLTGTDYTAEQVHSGTLQIPTSARALIVFHSEAAVMIKARFPGQAGNLHIIPQAVQTPVQPNQRESIRKALNLQPDEAVLLMAAGLRPVKNIGYALESFALLRNSHPRTRLLLAGPCLDEQESTRIRAAGERIAGFSFLGELPHARMLEIMQAADIFLNTSVHEGMPAAVMEAMAAGLAVIATDVPGNRALVSSMRTGLLVPLHSPHALLQACETLILQPELRRQLSAQARAFVREHYSCRGELDAHEQLYTRLLSA